MTKKPHGWYKEITIRPVVNVDGYEIYEKVCSYVADIFFFTNEQAMRQKLIINSKESIYISAYTLFKVGEAKCPAYWVGKDLLTALQNSELDLEIDSLHWAMKTGIFMLPKNTVFSPENDPSGDAPNVATATLSQSPRSGDPFLAALSHSISAIFWHYSHDEKELFWTAIDQRDSFCRKMTVNSNVLKSTYVDIQDIEDYKPQVISEFNDYLQNLLLRLILIMGCRPELIEQDDKVIKVNGGFGKGKAIDLYQPLWIGRNYSIKRDTGEPGSGGVQGTKRVHWRRGFLRNQPYGQGRQQRKLVWIEPVLVMGGS